MTETSRRHLLVGGATLTVGGVLDAIALEPNWLDVTEHDVAVPGLHRVLDGFTIAQVTDAHLDGIGRVEEAIARELESACSSRTVPRCWTELRSETLGSS